MTDDSHPPETTRSDGSDPSSPNTTSTSQLRNLQRQRGALELELVRVRRQAEAAKWDAKAAELEMEIRALAQQEGAEQERIERSEVTRVDDLPCGRPDPQRPHFLNWDQVRLAQTASSGQPNVAPHRSSFRFDAAHTTTAEPHFDDSELEEAVSESRVDRLDVGLDFDETRQLTRQDKRRRPTAVAISFLTHVAILVVLGLVTLQNHRPRDQVTLSASPTSESDVSIETFSIESAEIPSDRVEPTESKVDEELRMVDELAPSSFTSPTASNASSSLAAMLSHSSDAAAAIMNPPSPSDAKMQFCGLDGGGNHFVYLVDSSASMGGAFASARQELLRSIHQLEPTQRFYVIFFDSEPDFMRLSRPDQDEPRSVCATPANKAALQRWAMTIKMDRGKNPNGLLPFVLGLRADAIFLLSDGEFPQTTEDLLREQNQRHNLFGDGGIISIVHTIAYHSREGESRMRRIAQQNQGQYRYIAEP
ncbi:vWA domain-containing protein [Novipirellula artificiosorum]|uniref:hypothetical protein n=1 Tax=Novipirellula artificiosorum TaxID=2528016 RepID=UPI0011B7CA95|nr:hypothetical protein [Novipirellula artificiosorum]